MKNKNNPFQRASQTPTDHQSPPSKRGLAGRLIGTLDFVVIITFLGAWITAFIFLNQYLASSSLSENILTNLSCISFFGGLIIAFLIAAVMGNLLHRYFWKF